jgi:hypothetical protein
MNHKLEAFRALLESETRARYTAEWERDGRSYPLEVHEREMQCHIKVGRKYANVDRGSSGCYMVDLATGEIFGIKAYGVIHRGHQYGTLDTINEWDWSDYRAVRKQKVPA